MATPFQQVANHFETASASWSRIADELKKTFALADKALLTERPATKFILTWMREVHAFNKRFSLLFKRKKQPPIADEFTAALAFCLEQFLAARGRSGCVHSESTLQKKRGAMRPDVSVLSNEKRLVATVECKTNFGWHRKGWKEECEARNAALLALFSDCTFYICRS